MHDFNCTKADEMNFDLLAERTRYFKETQEGVDEMCKVMEDMVNEAEKKAEKKKAVNIASNLLQLGKLTCEEISSLCGISLEEVKRLQTSK